ncbi:uncharacterized protein LOC142608977 [Castanea sativa]|uniref:uncharacterized protein LOC142608977 n=1 Tax=Castanea sativa TaxID=21020 RepID=UPI003F64D2D4
MDPWKYLFEKPALSGRLSKWLLLLAEFDLKYVARKTIKGSVVSDFCAKNPIEGKDGILLITPEGSHIPLEIKLNFEATNNMIEYEACTPLMEALRELGVKEVEIFGDSTLIIAQAQKLWKVKEDHMKPYQQYLEDLTKAFDKIEYTIIPRAQNQFADALATLASMVEIPEGGWTRPLEIEQSYEEVHKRKTEPSIMTIEEEEVPWYYNIMKLLELGAYLDGANKSERHSIRMMATQYILCGEQLYRRSYDGVHLRCLKREEAERVMEEVYQGIYGLHMNERMLAKKILRIEYY